MNTFKVLDAAFLTTVGYTLVAVIIGIVAGHLLLNLMIKYKT